MIIICIFLCIILYYGIQDLTAAEETQIEDLLSRLLSDFDDYNSDDDEHVHSKFVNLRNFDDIQEEVYLYIYVTFIYLFI